MSQTLYKIRQLWEYVHGAGLKSHFTDELDKCVQLAFTADGQLKDTNEEFIKLVMREVQYYLFGAYSAYHTGYSRPLPYKQYEKFMDACKLCGVYVHNQDLQNLRRETEAEHEIGKTQPSPQTVITGEGGAAETHGNRMKELLARLREILTEFEAEG